MAAIKSVQNGTATIASGASSTTASITAVDLTKAVLIVGLRKSGDNAPGEDMFRGYFSSSSELTFDRWEALGSETTVEWYVVEWSSGVIVQSGVHTDIEDTTVTAVVLADTFVLNTYKKQGSQLGDDDGVKAWLNSTTNLRMEDNDTALGNVTVGWFVVESTDFTVQAGALSMGSVTTADVTITAVDLAKTFALLTWSINGSAIGSEFCLRGHFTSTTNLRAERNATVPDPGTDGIRWQVIEITDGTSVQTGTFSFADGSSQESATVTATSNGSPITSGLGGHSGENSGTADSPNYSDVTLDLTTSTNLQADRGGTTGTADVEWFLIDWNAGGQTVTIGQVTETSVAQPVTANVFPEAPRNLVATAVSASQIDLTWNNVIGATGYDIERDGVVIVKNNASTSYSDTGLSASTSYTYRVRAVIV